MDHAHIFCLRPLLEDFPPTGHALPFSPSAPSPFDSLAEALLNQSFLYIHHRPFRLTEIEFYHHSVLHPDPFTHQQTLQHAWGEWYFHKIGKSFKGGSYKGVDFTIGNGKAYGGVLIRGIESLEGPPFSIEGPSLIVDYILATTSLASVAELDNLLKRLLHTPQSPLRLELQTLSHEDTFWKSPRVGLSLKRPQALEEKLIYLMQPYRYVRRPHLVRKNRTTVVLALYLEGKSFKEIQEITNISSHALETALQAFKGGQDTDIKAFAGPSPSSKNLAALYGAWTHRFVDQALIPSL